jgi:hypothetical protein
MFKLKVKKNRLLLAQNDFSGNTKTESKMENNLSWDEFEKPKCASEL